MFIWTNYFWHSEQFVNISEENFDVLELLNDATSLSKKNFKKTKNIKVNKLCKGHKTFSLPFFSYSSMNEKDFIFPFFFAWWLCVTWLVIFQYKNQKWSKHIFLAVNWRSEIAKIFTPKIFESKQCSFILFDYKSSWNLIWQSPNLIWVPTKVCLLKELFIWYWYFRWKWPSPTNAVCDRATIKRFLPIFIDL
jgi:hypothetical protein